MALPTALFALIASFALASVAIISSLDAQHGTARDRDSKEAIAAADAGAGVALLRLNRFKANLTESKPCIGPGGESVEAKTESWCPATPVESVGEATFSYRVSTFKKEKELSVISVGTSGSVSRRIEVGLASTEPPDVFATEQGIGQNEIRLNGGPDIETSLGTNGSITEKSENGQAPTICGDIRYGVGGTGPTETDCENEITEEDKALPSLVAPEGIETDNSNCRLVPNCPKPGNPAEIDPSQVDTYALVNGKEERSATNPWDAEAETINIGKNAVLTMGGQDYFTCGLHMNSNAQLIMAAGAEVQVRIFIRTPEECGLEPGAEQVRMEGGTIESTGFGTDGNYAVPEIYVLGESTVVLVGNGTNELILYAPYSDVTLGGTATWSGLIAGKTLTFEGHSKMIEFPGEGPVNPPLFSLWERTRYVECTGASATPPDASC